MPKKKSKRDANRLCVVRHVDVPLREVSGICLSRGEQGKMSLLAVGDHAAQLARGQWAKKVGGDIAWEVVDLHKFPGSELPRKHAQLEAICADGCGRVLLLQESPPRAELFDLTAERVVATIELAVPESSELAAAWLSPNASRGEGMALLPGGHLLVVKEKDPPLFIEFGPAEATSRGLTTGNQFGRGERWDIRPGNHTYVPLAVWTPDKSLRKTCTDFSDLEIGPDGVLYLLSDQSAAIARLAELSPGGGQASLTACWKLESLDGKPEGLAFSAQGQAVVALDTRKARNNLVLLDPPIAATD